MIAGMNYRDLISKLDEFPQFARERDVQIAAIKECDEDGIIYNELIKRFPELKKDKEFIELGAKRYDGALQYADQEFLKNKKTFVIRLLKSYKCLVPSAFMNDKECLLASCNPWMTLDWLDEDLQNDEDIIIHFMMNLGDVDALNKVPDKSLKGKKEFILRLIKSQPPRRYVEGESYLGRTQNNLCN